MKIKIKARIKIPVRKTFRKVEDALEKPLAQAARTMAGIARESVRIPWPPASAKYAPPHLRSGKLRTGITSFRRKRLLYIIQATAMRGNFDYAQALEYGTKRMKPRPFMRPMIMKTYKSINIFFKGAF
jgi:hypothetical protein